MSAEKRPLLSIVLAGRNDNYGGDFRERLEYSISWVHKELTTHRILSEIIFVNYNPLPEPPVETFIAWPRSNEFVSVRIITVPSGIHKTLVETGQRKNIPMLEYPAKNAGILRATGEFVLCMNPDILIPGHFFRSAGRLKKDSYYVADRIDFKSVHNGRPVNFIKAFLKGHSYAYPWKSIFPYYWLRVKNYFLCKWKLNSVRYRDFFIRRGWNVYFHNVEFRYHTNNSGDFMLLHRDNWQKLRGYNEQSFISLHIDALMVIQAAMMGLKEKALPVPLYHQEHSRRFDSNDENPAYREAYLFFQNESQKMMAAGSEMVYNPEDWGMKGLNLEEKLII